MNTGKLSEHLDSMRIRYPDRPLQVSIQLWGRGTDFSYGTRAADGATRRFHTASIGKLLTATVIVRMIEAGRLDLETPLASLLPADTLDDLFVLGGADHRDRVTVEHLLGHTSGVADYFAGIYGGRTRGQRFTDRVVTEPDHLWTPAELLACSRDAQKPVAPPGERFHYSDSGYVLLGMIAEGIDGASFGNVLDRWVFEPAGMSDSRLAFDTTGVLHELPAIDPVWLHGHEISGFTSLSCDWAGGGVLTTAEDLQRLNRFFWGEGVSDAHRAAMMQPRHRFHRGLWYGLGMMELRLGEFSWFLRRLPRCYGHIGVLGTHLWYDPASGCSIVINVGDTGAMNRSFRLLIRLMVAVEKSLR